MKGFCKDCTRCEKCTNTTGLIFGGCDSGFCPKYSPEMLEQLDNITEAGDYIAISESGRAYSAIFADMGERLNGHFGNGCGIMYFCIPSDVKIIGYIKA